MDKLEARIKELEAELIEVKKYIVIPLDEMISLVEIGRTVLDWIDAPPPHGLETYQRIREMVKRHKEAFKWPIKY